MAKRKPAKKSPGKAETAEKATDNLLTLKVRLTEQEMQRIRVAAAVAQTPHSKFVRAAALEKADEVIRDSDLLRRLQSERPSSGRSAKR
jgi:uncharacterized protein (DUF1778 family)